MEEKGNFFKRHWKKFVLLFLFLLLLTGGFGAFVFFKGENNTAKSNIETVLEPPKGCTSNADPVFTHEFTDLSKIDVLGVLGGMTGGSPGRSYIYIKEGKVPVYAPTDATIETIVYARRGGPTTPGEYGLYFRVSCEVTFLFDHIDEVSDKIRAVAPQEPAESSRTELGTQPKLPIKAGELIGYSDGTPLAHTFDFQLQNTAKPAFHINPQRWDWEPTVYASCPYDYYQSDLKDKHYKYLKEQGPSDPQFAQSCGSPSQDIAGTISGGWFLGDSTTTKGKWLGVASLFGGAELKIRENGQATFALKEFDSKTLPANVKVGEEVCYQGYENNWAYFSLIAEDKIKFAFGQGKCPAALPATAEVWER